MVGEGLQEKKGCGVSRAKTRRQLAKGVLERSGVRLAEGRLPDRSAEGSQTQTGVSLQWLGLGQGR